MPRTKFTPNQRDLKAIKDFLRSVSWGSECTLCTQLDGSRVYLMTDSIVWLPCHWEQFEKNIEFCKQLGKNLNRSPGFIFYDRAPDYDCDRITWQAHREGFAVHWNDVHNAVSYSGFLVRALDGIEWWNPANWNIKNEETTNEH